MNSLKLVDDLVLVRKLILSKRENFLLCPLNTEFEADIIKKENIFSIADIIWHRTSFIRPSNEL